MNSGAIWIGTDYAWKPQRGRGQPLPLDAERVKIINKKDELRAGAKRSSTFCEVMRLKEDGEPYGEGEQPPYNYDIEYRDRYSVRLEVRGYDIVALWDDYEAEREPILADKRRKEAEAAEHRRLERIEYENKQLAHYAGQFIYHSGQKQLRLERERKAAEEQAKLEAHKQRIRNVLITRGFKREDFEMQNGHVIITLSGMEKWLGIETYQQ